MSREFLSMADRVVTGEALQEMGDMGPCELVEGRVVRMSPTGGEHGLIESFVGAELSLFVRERKLGWVLVGEVGIYTRRNPDTIRAADIAVLSRRRAPEGPPGGFLDIAPDLVVEIVSPSDRWREIQQKMVEYFETGVEQVWIVDPGAQNVSIYSSAEQMTPYAQDRTVEADGVLEGFKLNLRELFGQTTVTRG